MDAHELLEHYESRGEEEYFLEAKPLYERALAAASEPKLLLEYGYLLECHGRNTIRLAVEQYERAIELDPSADKPRYQLIAAKAALRDTEEEIARYQERLAARRASCASTASWRAPTSPHTATLRRAALSMPASSSPRMTDS
jgi:tetratricopeptide (TPR) repeat protein